MKLLFCTLSLFFLVGCTTQTAVVSDRAQTTVAVTPVPTVTPSPIVAAEPTPIPAPPPAPHVLIKGKTSKAIIEQVHQARLKRGMKVINRGNNRIEFSQKLPKSTPAAEIRLLYQVLPEVGAQRLSAQVFRITAPGTAQEKVSEITQEVADKLNEELATYAK